MCFKCCSVKQQKICVFTLGSALAILGLVLITAWPVLSKNLVNSMLTLSPNSFMFSKWVVTPIPLYFNFYMFNWTNPHQVNDSSVKPNFEELGPYVFREIRIKENLKWLNNRNMVTFHNRRTWYFDPSKSNGSLEDLITAPHIPSVTAARIIQDRHVVMQKILNFALNREGGKLFTTNSVREWIFDGFYDDLYDFVARLQSPIIPITDNKFAYFYKRNGTYEEEGNFTIYTGAKNLKKIGDLQYWNGLDHTKFWEGECGRVNGTTGELFGPGKKWHEPVSIFFSDACRFLNIYPQKNEEYRGIVARRYASTELTIDSGHKVADTKCFCVKGRKCPKNGVIDFSPAAMGAPIYLSHPHFNMADPLYRENTTGLNPDPAKHAISVLLEPTLGIPLDIDGRVALSILMEKNDNIDLLSDLAWDFYAPLFTLQIQTTITDDLLRVIKFTLNLPQLGVYLGMVIILLGLIIFFAGAFTTIRHKWHNEILVLEKRLN